MGRVLEAVLQPTRLRQDYGRLPRAGAGRSGRIRACRRGAEMTVPVGKRCLRGLILSCPDHCVRMSLMASCMWSLRCHTTKTNLQQFARTCRIPISLPHGYQYAKHGNTVSRIGGNHGCNRKVVEPHWKRSSLAVIGIVFIKRPRGESAKDSSPIRLEQKHCHYGH